MNEWEERREHPLAGLGRPDSSPGALHLPQVLVQAGGA